MCRKCDGLNDRQIDGEIMSMIESVGWAVIGVQGKPGFSYTVGLTMKKLPELYVADLPTGQAHRVLNALGKRQYRSELAFDAGQEAILDDGSRYRLDKLWSLGALVVLNRFFGDGIPARPTALHVVPFP